MYEAGEVGVMVGRRVRFFAGYGGVDSDGVIVAVHNEAGDVYRIRVGGNHIAGMDPIKVSVDVVLDDGRRLDRMTRIDEPGIGIKLRPGVVDAAAVLAAKQRHAMWAGEQVIAKAKAKHDFEKAEAARVITDPPVFYWNGIKDAKGEKLQRCHYSRGPLVSNSDPAIITIYARDYQRFSAKVRECFAVQNDTDSMVDYFESDRIRVLPCHPLYGLVAKAHEAQEAHRGRQAAKRRAA